MTPGNAFTCAPTGSMGKMRQGCALMIALTVLLLTRTFTSAWKHVLPLLISMRRTTQTPVSISVQMELLRIIQLVFAWKIALFLSLPSPIVLLIDVSWLALFLTSHMPTTSPVLVSMSVLTMELTSLMLTIQPLPVWLCVLKTPITMLMIYLRLALKFVQIQRLPGSSLIILPGYACLCATWLSTSTLITPLENA